MSTWTTAVTDLRRLLADNVNSRLCSRKKVLGDLNGSNTQFTTFEFRRLTDFTSAAWPVGVFLGNTQLAASAISEDDVNSGTFILSSAPADDGRALTATYYFQWFLDAEIEGYLTNASNWMSLGSDYTLIPGGLQPAALHYAAQDGLRQQAMRWSMRASDKFLLEDAPKKEALGVAETFLKLADSFAKRADELRAGYYKRADQPLAPLFKSNWGAVSATTPRR